LPVYGIFFLIVALSSMGMPATNGFIGELYVLIGAYKANRWFAIPVVLGVLLGTVYLLWLFQRVFLGDYAAERPNPLNDVVRREIVAVVPILFVIFWIGLYPKPVLRVMDASTDNLLKIVEENSRKSMAGKEAGSRGPGFGIPPEGWRSLLEVEWKDGMVEWRLSAAQSTNVDLTRLPARKAYRPEGEPGFQILNKRKK
jgi:NADH:ubiquinone oxidoreductase subunit 5 (subunit L)/multisubunit Na+/H+ antiporter MnhA subunit